MEDQEEFLYCLSGKEEFLDSDNAPRVRYATNPNLCAKAVRNMKPKHFNDDKVHLRFYIKMTPDLEPFNPKQPKDSINRLNRTCKSEYIFKEVNRSVFDKYISFLKTHNKAWLVDVKREIK